jgi:hypothetical protein
VAGKSLLWRGNGGSKASAVHGVRCWGVAVARSEGGGGGGDGDSSQYSSLLFFCYHCVQSFCLASVVLYNRNSDKGNVKYCNIPLEPRDIPPAAG